jgi:DnaJ-class molecular chaperone
MNRTIICPTCSGTGRPSLWKRISAWYTVCPQCAGRRVLPEQCLDPSRGKTEPRREATTRELLQNFARRNGE